MLFTDIDCFCHLFVDDLAKEINVRINFWDTFDITKIISNNISNCGRVGNELNAEKIGYFKDETKSDLIVDFIRSQFKMYSFTVCCAEELILMLNY